MARRATLVEAAERLGLSRHYLYTEARAGKIPCLKAGSRYVFDVEQVDEFLKKKCMEQIRKADSESTEQYGRIRKING